MANYLVELAVKVTDAVIIEVYEVEASSPEDAAQWLLLNDEEARLVSSYVSGCDNDRRSYCLFP